MLRFRLVVQEALVEAAVEEEKRRILEQKEEMEKSADETREGFLQKEALLEVGRCCGENCDSAQTYRRFVLSCVYSFGQPVGPVNEHLDEYTRR